MRTTAIPSTIGKRKIPGSEANEQCLKFVVTYREVAKRKQRVFATEEAAIEFVRTKNPNFRHDPIQETQAQAAARILLECTNKLNVYGKTIRDATDFFVQHLIANEKSCTAAKLVDEFVWAKQKQAASPFELDNLRSHLAPFSKRFDGDLVGTITSAKVDDWLRSLNLSIIRRNHYRRLIMLAFDFAVQRGYVSSNPVLGRFVVSQPI
jgi:hypothetical protein